MKHQHRMHLRPVEADLEPDEVRSLLSTLCVQLGFCLAPDQIDRLASAPPGDSDQFAEAVLAAEGYVVMKSDPVVVALKELCVQAFLRHWERSGS